MFAFLLRTNKAYPLPCYSVLRVLLTLCSCSIQISATASCKALANERLAFKPINDLRNAWLSGDFPGAWSRYAALANELWETLCRSDGSITS